MSIDNSVSKVPEGTRSQPPPRLFWFEKEFLFDLCIQLLLTLRGITLRLTYDHDSIYDSYTCDDALLLLALLLGELKLLP